MMTLPFVTIRQLATYPIESLRTHIAELDEKIAFLERKIALRTEEVELLKIEKDYVMAGLTLASKSS